MAIKDLTLLTTHLFLCNGGTCKAKGAEGSTSEIRNLIDQAGLSAEVHTTKTLCNGRCQDGPIVIAMPQGYWFSNMVETRIKAWFEHFILRGEPPEKNLLFTYGAGEINDIENWKEVSPENESSENLKD